MGRDPRPALDVQTGIIEYTDECEEEMRTYAQQVRAYLGIGLYKRCRLLRAGTRAALRKRYSGVL